MQYTVRWAVVVDADDAHDAARQAFGIMDDALLNPVEGASVLIVTPDDENELEVAFDEWGDGAPIQTGY